MIGELSELKEIVIETLEPQRISVKLGGERFVLVEASTDAAVKYKDARLAAIRQEDGVVKGIAGLHALDPLLVSLCLFRVVPRHGGGEDLQPVPERTVRGWKESVTKRLVEEIKRLSPDLDARDTPETLRKQIEVLQRSLERLESAEGKGGVKPADPTSGSPSATTVSSA